MAAGTGMETALPSAPSLVLPQAALAGTQHLTAVIKSPHHLPNAWSFPSAHQERDVCHQPAEESGRTREHSHAHGWVGRRPHPPWPISCPLLPPALLHHKALCNDSLFLHALPDTSMHCRPITIPQAAAWGSSAEHHNFAVQGQSQQ